jgi:predicted Zn-dependent peptidase
MNSYKISTVHNITVVRVLMPAVKSLTALVLVNTGSRYEKPHEQGIAHFLEHMVFKGTEKYPTSQILAQTVDTLGADYNAFTSKEYTGYYITVASRHIQVALDVLSEMLLKPVLKEEDIEREKGVIVEEINMYKDMPMHLISNLFEQMVFAGSGLAHDITGQAETVNRLTHTDFERFLQQWYGVGNILVVLAGDAKVLEEDAVLEAVGEAFSKEPLRERIVEKMSRRAMLSKTSPLSPHRLHIENKATEQAHIVMGWPGLQRTDERRYAQSLLSVILGGNMSSRLFTEVREKRGLCYYVRSDVDTYHDVGVFGAAAGVDASRVNEAIAVIMEQFYLVATAAAAPTADELTRAKEYLIGTTILSSEHSRNLAQFYGFKQLLFGKIETPDETLAKIKAVTLEEVQALATDIFATDVVRLAVIGPYPDPTKFEHYLGQTR